jgi:hypothetical protein
MDVLLVLLLKRSDPKSSNAEPGAKVLRSRVNHSGSAGQRHSGLAHFLQAPLALRKLSVTKDQQPAEGLEEALCFSCAVQADDVRLEKLHHLHSHRRMCCTAQVLR